MSRSVFISYARKESLAQAEALYRALGGEGGPAFLDTSDVDLWVRFQARLVDALLESRVVVIFASEEYFQRRYCLWELEAALGGSSLLDSGATGPAMEPMLTSIVVVLPPLGFTPELLLSLPPGLQERNWPKADDVDALVELVRTRLAESPRTLAERLEAVGLSREVWRAQMLEQIALPPPRNLATVRAYPRALSQSLGKSFVGRADDLWRIHYTLSVLRDERGTGTSGAALTGALQGTGGFGKTRLALEYLYRFGPSHYPGGVFWVNADVGPDRLEEQFHGILRTLKPEVPDLVEFRKSERDATREMAEALEAHAARERVLYVVDNVPEPGPDEAPKPLATWCPVIGKVSLLATSRVRLDMGTEGVLALPVDVLASEAAVALLMEGLGRGRLDDAGWRRIAEWVGHMPLALELLNRTLRTGALTPEELLSRTEQQGPAGELEKQMGVLRRYVPASALRGVIETFFISYERLSKAEQLAARLIAHLAPEPIPLQLLQAFGLDVATDEIRATLLSRHFVVSVDATGEVPMLGSMHRLLADYLRSLSPDSLAELRRVCRGLLVLMTPFACQDPGEWPLMNACLPHAESVFERLLEECTPRVERGLFAWLRGLFRKSPNEGDGLLLGLSIGSFLSARGLAARARQVEERVVQYAEKTFGLDHPMTLTPMHNLAATLRNQGDLQGARSLEERVLAMSRRVAGEEHPATLTYMSGLANTLHLQGELEGARALRERVLEARRSTLGEEHADTLTAMNDFASVLREQGNIEGARALLEQVLETRRSTLGEEHPYTLTYMSSFASTLREQGDLAGARTLQERVLKARLSTQGEEHPSTLTAMSNLAITLGVQGDLGGGRALLEQVLKTRLRVLGEAHPDSLIAMSNLAHFLRAQGNPDGARALEERALVLGQDKQAQ